VLQYFLGLKAPGGEVVLVEKANYRNACYDPARKQMTLFTDDQRRRERVLLSNSSSEERCNAR
jgi:hypothetical protein